MPKHILIIRTGALGDNLVIAKMLDAFHRHQPDSRLYLLTNHTGHELFKNDPRITSILNFQQLKKTHGKRGMIAHLKRFHFDTAINARWSSGFCALLSIRCAKVSIGSGPLIYRFFYTQKTRTCYSFRRLTHKDAINRQGIHEVEMIDQLTEAALNAQAATTSKPYIYLTNETNSFARDFFTSNQLNVNHTVLLAPGANFKEKYWPIDRFIHVCNQLTDKHPHIKILLNGMPGDEAIVTACQQSLNNLVVLPQTTIEQILGIVSQSTLVLCNNSGLLNVAYALNKPAVCVNTAFDWVLKKDNITFVNAFSKNHQGEERNIQSKQEIASLLDSIDADQVWHALDTLWQTHCVKLNNLIDHKQSLETQLNH